MDVLFQRWPNEGIALTFGDHRISLLRDQRLYDSMATSFGSIMKKCQAEIIDGVDFRPMQVHYVPLKPPTIKASRGIQIEALSMIPFSKEVLRITAEAFLCCHICRGNAAILVGP